MKLELWYPLDTFVVSQKFGENLVNYQVALGLKGHPGWDMVGKTGQICRAAHDGIVTSVEQDGRGGLGIVLRTEKKFEYKGGETFFKTVYWHMLPGSILVQTGQSVKCGDIIAKCDSTGVRINQVLASDSHLHFGLKPTQLIVETGGSYYANTEQENGYGGAIDPAPYWNGEYAKTAKEAVEVIAEGKSLIQRILEWLRVK